MGTVRKLTPDEINRMEHGGCTAENWENVSTAGGFDASRVRFTRFSGKVLLIGAAAASEFSLIPPNNASGNFTKVTQRVPIKISIDQLGTAPGAAGARLLPGMSVVVRVRTGAR